MADHLGHLVERRRPTAEARSSSVFRGGQAAADRALRQLALDGYAGRRRTAYPQPRRAVSRLSPWIRHGLLSLPQVWDSVAGGHPDDVAEFRQSLLRQEYSRHLYARLGRDLWSLGDDRSGGDNEPDQTPAERRQGRADGAVPVGHDTPPPGWDRRMGCLDLPLDELEEDGWVVDEGRRWLAAHWLERGLQWQDGAREFHRHLLDGSTAANGVGWLEAHGHLGGRFEPLTRWDVEARAPGLCASCELVYRCPVERAAPALPPTPTTPLSAPAPSPPTAGSTPTTPPPAGRLGRDPDPAATAGPVVPRVEGTPDHVWLTAESMGDADPALAAHPDLPAVFVFDAPLLARLRLSTTRLSFLVETLAELATRRRLELWLGDPVEVLADRRLAATFTPVPGWHRRAAALAVVVCHPWPWLRSPNESRIDSFDCWKRSVS
ncbi:MAG: deoxyribodipyrimidine photolyase [Actinomycetota bacterium]